MTRNLSKWIHRYGHTTSVRGWLKRNPPPEEWTECPEAYAFTEMPVVGGWITVAFWLLRVDYVDSVQLEVEADILETFGICR